MSDYDRSERIAIKCDSHIPEHEAIKQTDAELKAKELPESISRLEALHQRKRHDDAEKAMKKSTRLNYNE